MGLRVLASVHLYPPMHNCGSELVLHRIFLFLISKGHQCRVILHHYNGSMYVHEGVEVFPATGKVDAYRWSNIILTHLDYSQFTVMMAMEAKKPLVNLIHNDVPYSCINDSFGKQSVVYNSDWIKNKLAYDLPSYVLHPPCNATDYEVETTKEAITLISLNERKGGHKLYEIAKAMPSHRFIGVIGSYDNPGPLKMQQIDIINLLMQLPNVEIVPNTPDILATYRRTRILLMPSDYESWGRTATEAMCSGIPVICTPTAGLKENCGDAAVYVGSPLEQTEPGDAQVDTGEVSEWVAAIKKVEKDYEKYSVLCKSRAAALNPVKELEGLEQFLLQQVYE